MAANIDAEIMGKCSEGIRLLAEDRPREAADMFTEALALLPGNRRADHRAVLLLNRAECFNRMGDKHRAEADSTAVLGMETLSQQHRAKAHLRRAMARRSSPDATELQQAVADIGEFLRRTAADPTAQQRDLITELREHATRTGEELFQRGQAGAALRLLEQVERDTERLRAPGDTERLHALLEDVEPAVRPQLTDWRWYQDLHNYNRFKRNYSAEALERFRAELRLPEEALNSSSLYALFVTCQIAPEFGETLVGPEAGFLALQRKGWGTADIAGFRDTTRGHLWLIKQADSYFVVTMAPDDTLRIMYDQIQVSAALAVLRPVIDGFRDKQVSSLLDVQSLLMFLGFLAMEGTSFVEGDYSPPAPRLRPAVYKELAEQGIIDAAYCHANCLELGIGSPSGPDLETAVSFYLQAASLGEPRAQLRVAWLYETNTMVPPCTDERERARFADMYAMFALLRGLETGDARPLGKVPPLEPSFTMITHSSTGAEIAANEDATRRQLQTARFTAEELVWNLERRIFLLSSFNAEQPLCVVPHDRAAMLMRLIADLSYLRSAERPPPWLLLAKRTTRWCYVVRMGVTMKVTVETDAQRYEFTARNVVVLAPLPAKARVRIRVSDTEEHFLHESERTLYLPRERCLDSAPHRAHGEPYHLGPEHEASHLRVNFFKGEGSRMVQLVGHYKGDQKDTCLSHVLQYNARSLAQALGMAEELPYICPALKL